MTLYWIFPLVTCISVLLTGILRCHALAHSLMDVPNARSSHMMPTPRGGGLAIVVSLLGALPFLAWGDWLPWTQVIAFMGAGSLVALIGFVDDYRHLAPQTRLVGHFLSAFWALYWLGGLPPIVFFGFPVDLSWVGHFLAAVYLVWLLNLYNFMDGIDGIASIEAVTVCLGGALLYWMVTPKATAWVGPVLLVAAVAGFLVWNYPPARIFLGDVGSGFLGLILGVMSIQAAWIDPTLFWAWVILLAVFIVDATVTLLRRVTRGEKFYVAHRNHAYQYASRKIGSHKSVSLAVGAINLLWLTPIALIVGKGYLDEIIGAIVAYVPIFYLVFRFKAGAREIQEV